MNTKGAIISTATALFLIGCSVSNSSARPSGFMKDYTDLVPDPIIVGTLVYRAPPPYLRAFDKVIVEPIVINYHSGAKPTNDSSKAEAELKRHFRRAIVSTFKGSYTVVDHPDPGTARIRAAITNLHPRSPLLSVLGNAGTRNPVIGLGGACVEIEVTNAVTGERIFAAVSNRRSKRIGLFDGFQRWNHAKELLTDWAFKLKGEFDSVGTSQPSQ